MSPEAPRSPQHPGASVRLSLSFHQRGTCVETGLESDASVGRFLRAELRLRFDNRQLKEKFVHPFPYPSACAQRQAEGSVHLWALTGSHSVLTYYQACQSCLQISFIPALSVSSCDVTQIHAGVSSLSFSTAGSLYRKLLGLSSSLKRTQVLLFCPLPP